MHEREEGTAVCDEEAARERCAALYPRDLPKREYDKYLKGRPSDAALKKWARISKCGGPRVGVMFEHHTNRFQTRFGQLVDESYKRGCQGKSLLLSLRKRGVLLRLASSPISVREGLWAWRAFRTG
jgi:hypothetical protein